MIKEEAVRQLNIGYLLLIVGFVFGTLIHKKIGHEVYSSGFLFAYFLWSVYWGYKIMYYRISHGFSSFFNTPVHIEAKDTFDYFSKSIAYKYTTEFIKFWVCYFVGAFGGAIFKQIQLSRIAYFKY